MSNVNNIHFIHTIISKYGLIMYKFIEIKLIVYIFSSYKKISSASKKLAEFDYDFEYYCNINFI